MKKILMVLCALFLIVGCNKKDNDNEIKIPSKNSATDTSPITSPVNGTNLDDYLFRDDVQYIDVRNSKGALQEGYIAGFKFVPYYSIIASFNEGECLYKMQSVENSDGSLSYAGQVGGFVAQYEESEDIIKSMFSEEKYIFIVSQSGVESAYLINLLIQLGYDGNLLYNVGGVGGSSGLVGYDEIEGNKYFVKGIGDYGADVSYDFFDNLTPIH